MSLEEKKCEGSTKSLVDKFATNAEAVAFYTSTDPSTKLTREERMHIVPILCKYSKDAKVID